VSLKGGVEEKVVLWAWGVCVGQEGGRKKVGSRGKGTNVGLGGNMEGFCGRGRISGFLRREAIALMVEGGGLGTFIETCKLGWIKAGIAGGHQDGWGGKLVVLKPLGCDWGGV